MYPYGSFYRFHLTEKDESMDDSPHDPATIPAPASYHWTPALQRDFLESFAATGSVKISAARVGMSPAAVYQLKQRPQGAAFRLGCAAAVLIARSRLADELLDRAIWGHDEMTTVMREEDRSLTRRRRIESRLGLAMLARLDRMVETRARAGEEMLAQVIASDWPGFLSLFEVDGENRDEGHNAALALWLAGRDNRANPLAALWKNSAIANEVAQISADFDEAPEAGPTPEQEAAAMTVWYDDGRGAWLTDFPPPDDYLGIEEGEFGDADYERTLDPDEEAAFLAAREAAIAPLRKAGEAARRAFFQLPDPANDPAPADKSPRKSASG